MEALRWKTGHLCPLSPPSPLHLRCGPHSPRISNQGLYMSKVSLQGLVLDGMMDVFWDAQDRIHMKGESCPAHI